MFVFGGNNSGIRDDYKINNSLRFRSSASAYLNRTPTTDGSDVTWTFSTWVKRGQLGVQQTILSTVTSSTIGNFIGFLADDTFSAFRLGATYQYRMITTQVFRDPSAWYHILEVYDSTQATESDRVKIYINGVQVTAFSTATYPALNVSAIGMNKTLEHRIGRMYSGATYLDGYLTETYMVDGQALTPSSFGYTHPKTGVWRPKPYTGTYGTNGFYLKFSDIATTSGSNAGLGKDFSGNGNYWNTNNISVTAGTTYDAMTDSPTLGASASNYAVLNRIDGSSQTQFALSNGNLTYSLGNLTTWTNARASFVITSGKWYWEITPSNTQNAGLGIALTSYGYNASPGLSGAYSLASDGSKWVNGTNSAYSTAWAANDVIGVAYNADNGTLEFYKNNTSLGNLATGITSSLGYVPIIFGGATTAQGAINFGQRPFTYTPPTGFKALNTYNLPNVTIPKGNKVMDATLYTGTLATLNINNNAEFTPSLVWIKSRSAAGNTNVYDAVRGATLELETNFTNAEATVSNGLTSFNSNGFTLGNNAGVNASGTTYVAWQWQAGQGTTSSNTQGSITSTVSVNATAGFSVVTYTGTGANATVGHGLGVAPKMIIAKRRDSGTDSNWQVWHTSLTSASYFLQLNTTAAQTNSNSPWATGTVNSTIFSVEGANATNNLARSSATYVAYCWAEIAGFSKFGSYTGNGSTDGTFVYTGFRPKYILAKRTNATSDWWCFDTSRLPYNTGSNILYPNTSGSETTSTGDYIDILSNGFKFRGSGSTGPNANGAIIIYMAFAENPFKYSLAR